MTFQSLIPHHLLIYQPFLETIHRPTPQKSNTIVFQTKELWNTTPRSMLTATNNQMQHSLRHPAPAHQGLTSHHLPIYQTFFWAIQRPKNELKKSKLTSKHSQAPQKHTQCSTTKLWVFGYSALKFWDVFVCKNRIITLIFGLVILDNSPSFGLPTMNFSLRTLDL